MRDRIKNEDFFRKSLSFTEESINDFEKIMPQVIEKQGADSQGAKNGCNALVMYYTKKVNLLYSLGESIIDVKQSFEKLLGYYATVWDMEYGYIELIRILSLSALLNINSSNCDFEILEKKIKDVGLNDYLVNFLLRNIDIHWNLSTDSFAFKNIYDDTKVIVESENNERAILLKNYLNNKWYEAHNECAWYNSHNSKQDTYYGYWAYEAGAISKILKLNDEELKGQQYYPYDLVHFND